MEIKDYPTYLIYEDGRVFSKLRNIFIKTYITNGYLNICLCNNNKRKHFKIHRLIALHYIPNPNNEKYIDHIDGNKLNNNIHNLRWVSQITNCNSFKTINTNNTSKIKNISYHKKQNLWKYGRIYYGNSFGRTNKNKQFLLWVKFVDKLLFN